MLLDCLHQSGSKYSANLQENPIKLTGSIREHSAMHRLIIVNRTTRRLIMNFAKITISTLFTLITLAGLQSTASAYSRFDYLNQQSGVATEALQAKPKSPKPISQQMEQPQPLTMTQQDREINVNDVYPEYCRAYLSKSSGTVSLFEYFQALDYCQHGH
jgi:hypothetical protein